MTPDPWYVQLLGALTPLLIAVLGSGGLVALYRAVKDARSGKAQKEAEADARLVARLEKRIEDLEERARKDEKWQHRLVQALSRAGVEVPDRPE